MVNALAYQVVNKMKLGKTPDIAISPEHFEQAKEERVRRVIEPMLIGETDNSREDDNQYCIDLGLVKTTPEGLEIANDIYKEIIPRELTQIRQIAKRCRLN